MVLLGSEMETTSAIRGWALSTSCFSHTPLLTIDRRNEELRDFGDSEFDLLVWGRREVPSRRIKKGIPTKREREVRCDSDSQCQKMVCVLQSERLGI